MDGGSFGISSGMPEASKLTSFAVKEPKIATRVALTITRTCVRRVECEFELDSRLRLGMVIGARNWRKGKGWGIGIEDWKWNWAQEPAGGIISTLNSKGAVEACLKCWASAFYAIFEMCAHVLLLNIITSKYSTPSPTLPSPHPHSVNNSWPWKREREGDLKQLTGGRFMNCCSL